MWDDVARINDSARVTRYDLIILSTRCQDDSIDMNMTLR